MHGTLRSTGTVDSSDVQRDCCCIQMFGMCLVYRLHTKHVEHAISSAKSIRCCGRCGVAQIVCISRRIIHFIHLTHARALAFNAYIIRYTSKRNGCGKRRKTPGPDARRTETRTRTRTMNTTSRTQRTDRLLTPKSNDKLNSITSTQNLYDIELFARTRSPARQQRPNATRARAYALATRGVGKQHTDSYTQRASIRCAQHFHPRRAVCLQQSVANPTDARSKSSCVRTLRTRACLSTRLCRGCFVRRTQKAEPQRARNVLCSTNRR